MIGSRLWSARIPSAVRGIATSRMASEAGIKFGPYEVTKQVFLKTPHSFGLVNLKPLLPGHVLICPLTPHRRLTDLTSTEVTDLFATVQLTQRLLARTYFPSPGDPTAGSFTVAVQDGTEAGQTVPHVHVHLIPRQKGQPGNPDEVYERMAAEEGNVGGALWDQEAGEGEGRRPKAGGGMPRIEDEDRAARTDEQMNEEAERYKEGLGKMGIDWNSGGGKS